jgi:hypothetical protein
MGGVQKSPATASIRARLRSDVSVFKKRLAQFFGKNSGEKTMTRTVERPPLTIVDPAASDISPLTKLGPPGLNLWNSIMSEYRIEDPGGLELLRQACATLDRAESLAGAIARDGDVVYTRTGVPKSHPAVKDELACRALVIRTLERLGVTTEAVRPTPGRPPRG